MFTILQFKIFENLSTILCCTPMLPSLLLWKLSLRPDVSSKHLFV